jgi:hypothetical protein
MKKVTGEAFGRFIMSQLFDGVWSFPIWACSSLPGSSGPYYTRISIPGLFWVVRSVTSMGTVTTAQPPDRKLADVNDLPSISLW